MSQSTNIGFIKQLLSSSKPAQFVPEGIDVEASIVELVTAQCSDRISTTLHYTVRSMVYLAKYINDGEALMTRLFSLIDMQVLSVNREFIVDKRRCLQTKTNCFDQLLGDDRRMVINEVGDFVLELYAAIQLHKHDVMQHYLRSNKSLYAKAHVINLMGSTPLEVLSSYSLTPKAQSDILSCLSG